MSTKWIRTCQECGNKQQAHKPKSGEKPPDRYMDAKCRKCGSTGLDYGKEEEID